MRLLGRCLRRGFNASSEAMKLAACCICGKIPATANEGDWLEFQDYHAEGIGMSHPAGLEFFCDEHIDAARSLTGIDSTDALKQMRAVYAVKCVGVKKWEL